MTGDRDIRHFFHKIWLFGLLRYHEFWQFYRDRHVSMRAQPIFKTDQIVQNEDMNAKRGFRPAGVCTSVARATML